ncbi:RNA polymerase recycling motor HelD [Clostridium magnum]|uniref:Helicase IV n=1 Tax=Clostridium magnum DSM 2767 TaxID=1121326 RepID=A0A161WG88_9CLOT|nr:RNA polymerase recycling motor HelD [Clostridium magnum]KZL90705.1 helicase IV [Clostridium magnum DSM 2767]SHI41045.1 DNA helicase-2 / ATP-dependent DNA helicase PcrA [Clostridium magnum DSM 2767]
MSISNSELNYEKRKLSETDSWLKKQIEEMDNSGNNLQEKVSALKKQTGGKYSYELDATIKLYEMTKETVKSYKEVKEQPYFARIDFREYRRDKESFYIGKIGLIDEKTGDEVVVDWRSPVADLYYSGTQGDTYYEAPSGIINGELTLKRKFVIKEDALIDAFDEGINKIILKSGTDESEESSLMDEFLRINLEASVNHKLKDIVATIQKEQNDIIRAEKNKPLVVQGSAGSGKTTVALHRLAYLLYKYQNRLSGEDILVIAPNKLFLDYISEVLPNLGVDRVRQKTFYEMALEFLNLEDRVITKDRKLAAVIEEKDINKVKFITNSSKIKNSVIFKTMMDRYVRYLEISGLNDEDIKVFDYILFDKKEIKKLFIKNLSHLPISKRKDEIRRYFNAKLEDRISKNHEIIDEQYGFIISDIKASTKDEAEKRAKIIEIYDQRDKKKEELKAESKKVLKEYFDNWKYDNVKELYKHLFNDKEAFEKVTSNKIPGVLSEYMKEEINTNFSNGDIDSDDLAPMLYLKFKMEGIEEQSKFQHIVIDEAQDYSMFQISLLKSISINNSVTIVGDVGQSIYFYKGISDWRSLKEEVYKGDMEYVQLTQSYRSTVEIVEFGNKVLEKQKNSLKAAKPVLRHGKVPEIIKYDNDLEFCRKIDDIVQEVEQANRKSIAVIVKTVEECEQIEELLKNNSSYDWKMIMDTDQNIGFDRIIIPSYMTKGLEFDCSVIYNCSADNYGNSELDKRLLYVILTRALHMEYVFYRDRISELIL